MFDLEEGDCQCISFILQLFFTNCISISIFCFTKLCTVCNDGGKILRLQCATKASCRMSAKVIYYFGSKDCMKLLGIHRKTETSVLMLPGKLILIIQISLSLKAVSFSSYQIPPCHPFIMLTSPDSLHLTSSKIKCYTTLLKYTVSLLWGYPSISVTLFPFYFIFFF